MALYPSLEDMKVDQMVRAQVQQIYSSTEQARNYPNPSINEIPSSQSQSNTDLVALYPTLNDYMGLELSENVIAMNMPEYLQIAIPSSGMTSTGMIAPVSGQSLGLQRAQVTNGVREVLPEMSAGNSNLIFFFY